MLKVKGYLAINPPINPTKKKQNPVLLWKYISFYFLYLYLSNKKNRKDINYRGSFLVPATITRPSQLIQKFSLFFFFLV